MLSALCWVKGSLAKSVPVRFEPEVPLGMEEEPMQQESVEETDPNDIEKLYGLDKYDEEEIPLFDPNPSTIMQFESNDQDPYLNGGDEDDESDLEDFVIRESDALIIGAHSEEDMSYLDVFIYEESEDNLYVHHDVILPSFPLCVCWHDFERGKSEKGNFVAVGTFEPHIEIWDLDVIDALEPLVTLGSSPSKKKKKKPSGNSHSSSVLGISWNRHARNILASGSADNTVKVWDLSNETCLQTLTHHGDKVQAVKWHPLDPKILLSGSFDRKVSVLDARYPQMANSATLSADVEAIEWNFHVPQQFLASSEDGMVFCYDVREMGKPVWSLSAHMKATSAMSCNQVIPNYLATVSSDKQLKLWSLDNDQPTCIYSTKTKLTLFDVSFYSESPFLLAAGGKGEQDTGADPRDIVHIVNTAQLSEVRQKFELQ